MSATIALASDHAGFQLKEFLRCQLGERVYDFGVYTTESVDYPDQALLVAEAVAAHKFELGLLICGTGQGMAITANKVRGIRAAVCHDTFSAHVVREHNDCNILTLGERIVGPGLAWDVVTAFLNARYLGEHHARRVAKMMAIQERHGP